MVQGVHVTCYIALLEDLAEDPWAQKVRAATDPSCRVVGEAGAPPCLVIGSLDLNRGMPTGPTDAEVQKMNEGQGIITDMWRTNLPLSYALCCWRVAWELRVCGWVRWEGRQYKFAAGECRTVWFGNDGDGRGYRTNNFTG